MTSKKFTVLPVSLLLLSTLAISGCIQLGQEEEKELGNGVMITSFRAFPSTVYSGEDYSVSLSVKNKGGREATDTIAYLYNIPNIDSNFKTIGSLGPTTEEFSGQGATVMWQRVGAPGGLGQGVEQPLNPKAKVYYKYTTYAMQSIPVVTWDYMKRVERQGGTLPSLGKTTVTRGPISVKIKSQSPVRVDSEKSDEKIRISVSGSNLLGGTPFNHTQVPDSTTEPPISSDYLNEVKLTLNTNSTVVNKNANIDNNCFGGSSGILLYGGNEFTKNCKIQIDATEIASSTIIPVTATLKYGYYVQTSTSLTVKGKAKL